MPFRSSRPGPGRDPGPKFQKTRTRCSRPGPGRGKLLTIAVLVLPPRLLTNFLRTHSGAPGLFDKQQWFRIFCSRIRHPSACKTFYSNIFLSDWKVIPWIHVGRNASIARFILTLGTSNHLDIPSDSVLRAQGRVLRFCCSFGNEFRNCIVLLFLISAWFTDADRTQSSRFYPQVKPILNIVSGLFHDERTNQGM